MRTLEAGEYYLHVYDPILPPTGTVTIEVDPPRRGQSHETALIPDQDLLHGGDGDDVLIGNQDRDRLFGDSGVDTFFGEPIEVRDERVEDTLAGDPTAGEFTFEGFAPKLDPVVEFGSATLVVFSENFDSGTFTPNLWEVTGPSVNMLGLVEPSAAYSANFQGTEQLVSSIIDLSGHRNASLSYAYERTGGGNSPERFEDLIVEYMTDTVGWSEIDRRLGADGTQDDMDTFEHVSLPLPAAALDESLQIRFTVTGTPTTFDDWFVDDIEIHVRELGLREAVSKALGRPTTTGALLSAEYRASELGSIADLDASAASITQSVITDLTGGQFLVNLRSLDLSGNAIDASDLGVLVPTTMTIDPFAGETHGVGELRSLNLGFNAALDGIGSLAKLTELQTVLLEGTSLDPLDANTLNVLENMPSLEVLTLPTGIVTAFEDFENPLSTEWVLLSSGTGRIARTADVGTGGVGTALIMDSNTYDSLALNRATWTVDLSSKPTPILTFLHADFSDEESPFSSFAPFTGNQNADGIAVSVDSGANWYPVWNAPNQSPGIWQPHTIDLTAAVPAINWAGVTNASFRFQQYDNYPVAIDGRGYDEIRIVENAVVSGADLAHDEGANVSVQTLGSASWRVLDENNVIVASNASNNISFLASDNGTFKVQRDPGGGFVDWFPILVRNLAPTITSPAPNDGLTINEGQTISIGDRRFVGNEAVFDVFVDGQQVKEIRATDAGPTDLAQMTPRITVEDPLGNTTDLTQAALAFDGSNDIVELHNSVLDGKTDVTTTFWMKTTNTAYQAILSGANAAIDNEFTFFVRRVSSTQSEFWLGTQGRTVQWFFDTDILDGNFHHIALVRDQGNQQFELYVDGDSKGVKTEDVSNVALNLRPIRIDEGGLLVGQDQDSVGGMFDPNQAFEGVLDELRMFNRVLTPEQIAGDMSGGPISGTTPNLVGYWPFNDGFGEIARDRSPGASDGSLGRDVRDWIPTWTTDVPQQGTINGIEVAGFPSEYLAVDDAVFKLNISVADDDGGADSVEVEMIVNNVAPTVVTSVTDNRNRVTDPLRYRSLMFDGINDVASTTLTLNDRVTIETWVRPTQGSDAIEYVFHTGTGSDAMWSLSHNDAYATSEGIPFWIIGNGTGQLVTDVPVELDQWQHIAVSFDVAGGVTLFKNGESVYTSATISLTAPTAPLTLGSFGANGSFQGELDELRVWNRLFTAEQVTAGMRTQVPGNSADLAAAWNFDERSGATTAADATGTHDISLDAGGAGLQPKSSEQIAPLESLEPALSFDGVDDVVLLSNSVLDGANDVSTTLWIRTTQTGAQTLISGANTGQQNEFLIRLASDQSVEFYSAGVSVAWPVRSLADGRYHHVAVVRDEANDQAELFIDSVSQGRRDLTMGTLQVDADRLSLGLHGSSTEAFEGTLDDLRIYDQALNAAGIRTDMLGGLPSTNLRGMWSFDDGGGNTARDLSAFGRQASLGENGVADSLPIWSGQALLPGEELHFDSSRSHDPGLLDTLTYAWEVESNNGQVIPGSTESTFSFTPDFPGIYTVTATVTDKDGDSTTSETAVSIYPVPILLHHLELGCAVGDVILYDASDSSLLPPPELSRGNFQFVNREFSWTVSHGNAQIIADGDQETFLFIAEEAGDFTTTLTVTDVFENTFTKEIQRLSSVASDTLSIAASAAVIEVLEPAIDLATTTLAPQEGDTLVFEAGASHVLPPVGASGKLLNTSRAYSWEVIAANGQVVPDFPVMIDPDSLEANSFQFKIDDDGFYTVQVTVTDRIGLDDVNMPLGTADYTVVTTSEMSFTARDVDPTITVTGPSTVSEGSAYTLNLGAVTDPGTDRVSAYVVDWGDGLADTYASAGDVTHTYADDSQYMITVDLVNEDGTFTTAGMLQTAEVQTLSLKNVDSGDFKLRIGDDNSRQTAAIIFSSDAATLQSNIETALNLIPGFTVGVTGDGTAPWRIEFSEPAGTNVELLQIVENNLVGLDSMIFAAPQFNGSTGVNVTNVVPSILLSGAAALDEGSDYTLTLGQVTDPGDDTVIAYVVDWGDGTTPDTYHSAGDVTHTYTDGDITPKITVTLIDEDGSHARVNRPASLTYMGGSGGQVNSGDATFTLSGNRGTYVNEVQTLSLENVESGAFTLRIGTDENLTTETIVYSSTPSNVRANIENALNALPGVTASVSGDGIGPWEIEFLEPTGSDVADLQIIKNTLAGPTSTILIGTESLGEAGVSDSVQTLTFKNPAQGDFKLRIGSDNTKTTAAINFSSDPATLKRNIEEAFNHPITGITGFTVSVTGDGTAPWRIEFTDPAESHVEQLQVVDNTLTGVTPIVKEATKGSGATSITVTEGQSLTDVRDLINAAEAQTGVVAAVFGDQLTLTSLDVGRGAIVSIYATEGVFPITGTHRGDNGLTLKVDDVSPSIALSDAVAGQVNEGALYTLNLGAVTDPGNDSVDSYIVDWGDGTTPDTYASAGDVTHVYADNAARTIQVAVVNEDGTHAAAGTHSVTVNNVDPILTVTASPRTVAEGVRLDIAQIASLTDPGFNTLSLDEINPPAETFTFVVNWGDGTDDETGDVTVTRGGSESVPTAGSFGGDHTYPDNGTYTVTVTVTDDDGGMATDNFEVMVSNSDPVVAIVGAPIATGYWPFDELSGETAMDRSGSVKHATLGTAGIATTQPLRSADIPAVTAAGMSLAFDGLDDVVELSNASLNNLGDTTVTFWLKTGHAGVNTILSGANDTDHDEFLLSFESETEFRLYSHGQFVSWTLPASIADNTYRQVGVVRDQTNQSVELIIDGVSLGQQSMSLLDLKIDEGGLFLGQAQTSVGAFAANTSFHGMIDELRIYDRVLSTTEVTNNLRNLTVNEGSELNVSDLATFFDAGFSSLLNNSEENFTYSINWGDSTAADSGVPNSVNGDVGITSSGTLGGSHTYVNDGSYVVEVTVADDDRGSATERLQVQVLNVSPTVGIGADRVTTSGSEVTFGVSDVAVSDPGLDDTLTYAWTITTDNGLAVVSDPADEASMSFLPQHAGTYQVTLAVTDSAGETGSSTIDVVVHPVAAIVAPMGMISKGDIVTFDTTGSTEIAVIDDSIVRREYLWTAVPVDAGNTQRFNSSNGATFEIVPETPGEYVVSLTITDVFLENGQVVNELSSSTVNRTVTVADQQPSIGFPQPAYTEGDRLQFQANDLIATSGISHEFLWTVTADNGQVVADGAEQSFDFVPADNGDYEVNLTVTDHIGPASVGDDFDSGVTLDDRWTAFSTGGGRVQISGTQGTASGSGALLMDSANGESSLNEAVYVVDLAGGGGGELSFYHAEWKDEEHPFDGPFRGHFNADGIAISNDGTNWYPIFDAPNQAVAGQWSRYSVDLVAEATAAGITVGPNLFIKFQQFDDGKLPLDGQMISDGRGYDQITVSGAQYTVVSTARSVPVNVANVAPTLVQPTDHEANEGLQFGFVASVVEPGAADILSYTIDWGDGTTPDAHTAAASSESPEVTIMGSHLFADDGTYTVTVSVGDDDQGADSKEFRVTVRNAAPSLVLIENQQFFENEAFTITELGQISDLGFANPANPNGASLETFTARVDWGDGSSVENVVVNAGQTGSVGVPTTASLDGRHVYADDGVYTVQVMVSDDDGASSTSSFDIAVINAAPELTVVADQSVNEGDLLSLTDLGIFSDPGFNNPVVPIAETFTYSIDWGDGTEADTGDANIDHLGGAGDPTRGSLDGSHVYADNGFYRVNVTVTDDDGGADFQEFFVTVSNVAPTLTVAPAESTADRSVNQDEWLSIADSFTFEDPGFSRIVSSTLETFTYSVDWGDGTAISTGRATVNSNGSIGNATRGSIDAGHAFAYVDVYTVTATVTDDDGDSTTQQMTVDVKSIHPDFGDAPAGYPVTLAENGARHTAGSLRLGTLVDAEVDGTPTADATADGSDDDGVTALASRIASPHNDTVSSFAIVASESGKLDAWIDFNGDGDWDDIDEQIFVSVDVSPGENVLSYTIPSGSTPGGTAGRFRLSTAGGLASTGAAADGEVEDYVVDIQAAGSNNIHVSSIGSGKIYIESRIREAPPIGSFIGGFDWVVRDGDVVLFQGPARQLASLAFAGTDGDDTILLNANIADFAGGLGIDGSHGIDTLRITGENQVLDITSLPVGAFRGLEFIDLTGSGANILTLSQAAIAALPDDGGTLTVIVNTDDTLNITDGAFVINDSVIENGQFLVIAQSASSSLQIGGLGWTNPLNSLDVNNSNSVSASDALQIINELGRGQFVIPGTNELIDPADLVVPFPLRFYDTSGDGKITALDALRVINTLSRLDDSGVAEREAVAGALLPPHTIGDEDQQDDRSTDFNIQVNSEDLVLLADIDVDDIDVDEIARDQVAIISLDEHEVEENNAMEAIDQAITAFFLDLA